MLILLPPSEGKAVPTTGAPLDLGTLSSPRLNGEREKLLNAVERLGTGNPRRSREVLGLGPTQDDALAIDAAVRTSPAARADEVYTGVLFSALDPASLDADARKRADATLAVCSALFGLVRPDDLIPSYRLSGNVTLPRLGTVAGRWRPLLPRAMDELAGDGLMVDLRSGTYVALGKPSADLARRTATMRVLHEQGGVRKVVSHFNKATKGRIVRALLDDGGQPATVGELADAVRDLGWTVEQDGTRLDVVVAEVPTH